MPAPSRPQAPPSRSRTYYLRPSPPGLSASFGPALVLLADLAGPVGRGTSHTGSSQAFRWPGLHQHLSLPCAGSVGGVWQLPLLCCHSHKKVRGKSRLQMEWQRVRKGLSKLGSSRPAKPGVGWSQHQPPLPPPPPRAPGLPHAAGEAVSSSLLNSLNSLLKPDYSWGLEKGSETNLPMAGSVPPEQGCFPQRQSGGDHNCPWGGFQGHLADH